MKKNLMRVLTVILTLTLCLGMMTGCGQETGGQDVSAIGEGGILFLRVNPEIQVEYDKEGFVTAVRGVNDDGKEIVNTYDNYIGKECKAVILELVSEIKEAGYFVEEVEGEARTITIEIEEGSVQPSVTFLDDIVGEIKTFAQAEEMHNEVLVQGDSDYGLTDYDASDYDDPASEYDASDYDDPASDYDASDYDDPASEYDASDYDDPASDYDASDYDNSDYGNSGYDSSDYDNSDYDNSDYDNSDYGNSGYDD